MEARRMAQRTAEGPLKSGETFLSKYEIRELIGQGGHACVYHAVNTFMGRDVAIKVLHRPGGIDRESLRRGQAEAQLLNRLRHPNIVEVIDAGMTDKGLLYIVMELLRGRSLREVLSEHGNLSVEEVLDIGAQVADGVHAAHAMSAIHRDLKPENVFVTTDQRTKILDFGIAKVADATAWTTDKDVAHGTVLYMSPEQLQLHKLTPRSDIYALGVIMYEALLGRHPISLLMESPRPTMWEISRTVLTLEPPMLDELDARIPRSVAALVNRAMAKLPEQRFASMEEFARHIRDCRAAWSAYAHVHGVPLDVRDLATRGALSRTQPLTPGAAPRASAPGSLVSAPLASTERTATPSTAAPVTTGLYRNDSVDIPGLGRPSKVRQVLLVGSLLGGAVGGTVAFLRFTGDVASSAKDEPVAVSAVAAPPAPPLPEPVVLPSAEPPAPAASAPASAAPDAAVPKTPQVTRRPTRPASSSPSTSTRGKVDKVEERLQRLEQNLGGK
jgi:eukaryotic-like serine/threonine-protein kinase